jgi:cell division septation protein DedD
LSNIHDDGFHEIQLNGKQLVFLFMAATVVSVVIFLIGVMVGRSVGEQRAAASETAALDDIPSPDVTTTAPPPDTPAPGSDPTKAAAPTSVEDLSYFNRLEGEKKPTETLKPPPAKTVATPSPAAVPPPATPPTPPTGTAATPAASTTTGSPKPAAPKPAAPAPAPARPAEANAAVPPGQGWVIQIAALTAANEANAIVKRWTSRGYNAYVQPPSNTNAFYRVRIGPYKTQAEADAAEAKLKKDGQATTWVTRP